MTIVIRKSCLAFRVTDRRASFAACDRTRRRRSGMTLVLAVRPCGDRSTRAGSGWHGRCGWPRWCSLAVVPPNPHRRRHRPLLLRLRQKRERTPHGATETSAKPSWTACAREVSPLVDWNGVVISAYAPPILHQGRHPPTEQRLETITWAKKPSISNRRADVLPGRSDGSTSGAPIILSLQAAVVRFVNAADTPKLDSLLAPALLDLGPRDLVFDQVRRDGVRPLEDGRQASTSRPSRSWNRCSPGWSPASPGTWSWNSRGCACSTPSGVGALIRFYKRLRMGGCHFTVSGLRDQPLAVFRLLRLDERLGDLDLEPHWS